MMILARLLAAFGLLAILAGIAWIATAARPLPDQALAGLTPGNAEAGARIYHAAGCASCHTAPDGAPDLLAGGQRFETGFGTFIAPNISPHPEAGIGGWSLQDFASALKRGAAPDGRHYYPAFPYTAYAQMRMQDIADLKAHMDQLPASDAPSQPHEVGFPVNITRALVLWKALYLREGWFLAEANSPQIAEGRYLAEALAHCGECHTPRTVLGGLAADRWMAGAPNPSGRGTIPSLSPAQLDWSADDIAFYLETGFTPEFDSAGGHMAAVVRNFARLDTEDRAAVAAYIKALPAAQ